MAVVAWEEAISVGGAARRGWKWLSGHFAVVVLVLTSAGLAAGLLPHVAGAGAAGNALWAAVGGCGAVYALGRRGGSRCSARSPRPPRSAGNSHNPSTRRSWLR
jgi:hypothetical protein